MSAEDMRRWVRDWYATHPVVGLHPTAVAADTFKASGTTFDTDGNAGTVVDTAHILTGETILWRATSGSHSVTNGTSSADPNAGVLFDAPLDLFDFPEFSHAFTSSGTYRFFCRPHEAFNMRGIVVVTDPVTADTFTTVSLQFDTDGSAATQIDTAFITVGQSILWRDVGLEFHSVTSGKDALDPEVGNMFDVPLDPDHLSFVFQYTEPGTFPFFCRPHEFDEMKGVVVVAQSVSADPAPVGKRIGFASEPAPNPTTGTIGFRVAMPTSGRARVEVFDTRGQLVAVPLNRELDAGVFGVSWNGMTRTGRRAASGVYHLRLALPGYSATRRIVLTP
jgi:plastocyanin